jgi:hypothetical protein
MEQLGNDLVLAFEMVIEVTGTDVHFIGNVYGRGSRLAPLVK